MDSSIFEWNLHGCRNKRKKNRKLFFFHILDLKEQTRHSVCSSEISMDAKAKQASEWAQRSARAKRPVRSKRMSERCERTSERTSEWPKTLRVVFVSFLPRAHRYETFFCERDWRNSVFHDMGMAFLSLETWCKERNRWLTCSLTVG